MHDQPFMPQEDDYLVYTYNRFQACRFGPDTVFVDPTTCKHTPHTEKADRGQGCILSG